MGQTAKSPPAKCPNCGQALIPSPMIPNAARCSACGVLVEAAEDVASDDTPTMETPPSKKHD